MELLIITGMSGGGKSQTINVLENLGYYCVDNMPPALIPKFVEICFSSGRLKKVAIVTDARGGDFFELFSENMTLLEQNGYDFKILYLDASDEALVHRYKETRRKHPLSEDGTISIIDAVANERRMLENAKNRADYIIDTTNLTPSQLKEQLLRIFVEKNIVDRGFTVSIITFGFKYGVPIESDLVFDVRFLPNPFYIEELRCKTGLDDDVYNYVIENEIEKEFEKKLFDMLSFLIPHYITEGKHNLVIGIGCTGGKHRSVAIASRLRSFLKNEGYFPVVNNRDIYKDNYVAEV